jgi:predicted MFS family arabinose efflux permease
MSAVKTVSERKLLFLTGAVLFVNILDFTMVMPLGPDLARGIGMPSSALGLVGGIYTAAAAISGLVGALFLDRFDRRSALGITMLGLVAATASGGLSYDLTSLLATRALAGAFGGPAASIAFAMIADVVPPERRGRAMGSVMGAFSLSSVLGVPAGLELARIGGWQLPFFAVAGLGAIIGVLVMLSLPPFKHHLEQPADPSLANQQAPRFGASEQLAEASLGSFFRPAVIISFVATSFAMLSSFSLAPNLSAYLQFNLGYPRDEVGLLYLVGGAVSFATLRLAGSLSDRFGPALTSTLGCAMYFVVVYLVFLSPVRAIPILMLFTGYMVTSGFRMVPIQALSSRVPSNSERARFSSTQSAVQHMASAVGAVVSSAMLGVDANGGLVGIERVAWFSLACMAVLPVLLYRLQWRVAVVPDGQAA